MMSNSLLIHIDDISFTYGEISLLSHISLDISRGDICVITGPSGSGKTTLLSIIGGIIAPTTGSVIRNGNLSPREKNIGYSFIDGPFFELQTVKENILFLEQFTDISLDRDYYRELLIHFEIDHFEDTPLIHMSVGQRERVNIVRALVHHPKLIILDEPGANLDVHLFDLVFDFIKKDNARCNTAYVIVAHDPRFLSFATKNITLTLA